VNDFLRTSGAGRSSATFTITGAATGGAWTFEGTDGVATK
jgi:hypothetical protein